MFISYFHELVVMINSYHQFNELNMVVISNMNDKHYMSKLRNGNNDIMKFRLKLTWSLVMVGITAHQPRVGYIAPGIHLKWIRQREQR